MVNYHGRDTWMVHHNGGDYRVHWFADTRTEVEDPRAVGDGEGFLSVLKPGDKIALWARAEVSGPTLCYVSSIRLTVACLDRNKRG